MQIVVRIQTLQNHQTMHIEHFNDDLDIAPNMSSNDSVLNGHLNAGLDLTPEESMVRPMPSGATVPSHVEHDYNGNETKTTFHGGGGGGESNGAPGGDGNGRRRIGQIHINRSTMSLASLERVHPPEEAYRARREL